MVQIVCGNFWIYIRTPVARDVNARSQAAQSSRSEAGNSIWQAWFASWTAYNNWQANGFFQIQAAGGHSMATWCSTKKSSVAWVTWFRQPHKISAAAWRVWDLNARGPWDSWRLMLKDIFCCIFPLWYMKTWDPVLKTMSDVPWRDDFLLFSQHRPRALSYS